MSLKYEPSSEADLLRKAVLVFDDVDVRALRVRLLLQLNNLLFERAPGSGIFDEKAAPLCEKCLGESGDSPIFSHVVRMRLVGEEIVRCLLNM